MDDEEFDHFRLLSANDGAPREFPPKLNYPAKDEHPEFADYTIDCLHATLMEQHGQTKEKSEAIWIESAGVAKVTKYIAKYFTQTGHFVNGDCYLLSEETLFLVDFGWLDLFVDGKKISVEYAYSLLLKNEHETNCFLTFLHLRRLGFIVKRHGLGFKEVPQEVMDILKMPPPKVFVPETVDDDIQITPVAPERIVMDLAPSSDPVIGGSDTSEVVPLAANLLPLAWKVKLKSTTFDDDLIDFDVYRPNSQFSKRNCGDPHFHLHIARYVHLHSRLF